LGRNVPVNTNKAVVDEARGIIDRYPKSKYNKITELAGEQAARDHINRTYRNRILQEIDVPRRGAGPPILDLLFELDNGEFVVVEAKGATADLGKTMTDVFEATPEGESRFLGRALKEEQFSPGWFAKRLKELEKKGRPGKLLAARLNQAWRNGKITALQIHARPTLPGIERHPKGDKLVTRKKGRRVDVENINLAEDVIDRSEEWNKAVGAQSRAKPPTVYNSSLVETISDASRLSPDPPLQERIVGGLNRSPRVALKARSLAVGVKAWKAVRTVGKIFVHCFVPLTVLDFVLEIAFALWDREREKEERAQREKQKSLEAVFKQKSRIQSLIQSKILNNTSLFDEFVESWDRNRKFQGFLYARLSAEVDIETFRNVIGQELEELTNYTVVGPVEVFHTNWASRFEFTDIGVEKEVDKTNSDINRLLGQGVTYPQNARKFIRKKRLKYTIVPPLITPFDIITTKINNLFLEVASLVTEANGWRGMDQIGFTSFNYNCSYDEQFTVALEFPHPLNESACRYCLSYLHWAAGQLSQHALTEQDLEGNLEDPTKGRERRFWLLMALLEGRSTRYKKNFSFLAERVRELVKGGGESEEVASVLEELYIGARAIWYDLERIGANIGRSEYLYFGAQPSGEPN
jgi:hypothetical protein